MKTRLKMFASNIGQKLSVIIKKKIFFFFRGIAHDFDEIWKILHLAREWIQIGIEELRNLIMELEEAKTSLQSVGN